MKELINKNDICFRCSYGGDCMAEIEDCKVCVHYVCDYEDIQNVDVITEQEIRNKAIDEFAEAIKYEIRNCRWQFSRLEFETIDEIAEQLKGGVK